MKITGHFILTYLTYFYENNVSLELLVVSIAPPPPPQISQFHAVFGKFWQNRM